MHEQRKPWVPLMLEASYRPNGWLGIMLGSRLYYEFTEAALHSSEDWERVADGVSKEVRLHGAPPPSASPTPEAVAVAAATAAAVTAPAVPKGPMPLMREAEAGVSVSVSSAVHNSVTNHNTNNNSNNNNNIGNTSIVIS